MNDQDEIANWFKDEIETDDQRLKQVLKKTRSATAQKDTMDLVFVKIWAAMAELLAPFFASLAKQQASLKTNSKTPAPNTTNKTPSEKTDDAHNPFPGEPPSCSKK